MGSYILLCLGAAAAWPFSESYSTLLLNIAEGKFGILSLGVAGFYFGPYMIGKFLGVGKGKA